MEHTKLWVLLLLIFKLGVGIAQATQVKGVILETLSQEPIQKVRIEWEGYPMETYSDASGHFSFDGVEIPLGFSVLLFEKQGYLTLRIPIQLQPGQILDLNPIYMELDWQGMDGEMGIISLQDNELLNETNEIVSVPGALQASKGIFEGAAAYDFSNAFFRPRGVDNIQNRLVVNGLEFNSLENGRPLWNLMGGLNDMQRNREGDRSFRPHKDGFGAIGNSTYFTMRASRYRQGGAISFASSNRTYRTRGMASYNSGKTASGWAYSLLLSKRYSSEGYVEGTPYNASSFLIAVERSWNSNNSVNITAFFTPLQRGRSTPLTDEVLKLKGVAYNPLWGYQNGRIRTSRLQEIKRPVVLLSHFGTLSRELQWENHLGLTFGRESISRLDNAGFRNPYPHYYQRLPSYFLREEAPSVYDYQQAYWAREAIENDGQLDWGKLFEANQNSSDGYAKYVLMKDVSRSHQFQMRTSLYSNTGKKFNWYASASYRQFRSEKYAKIDDLLGTKPFLDIDAYYDGNEVGFEQSNTERPSRAVEEGGRYKYHFLVGSDQLIASAQLQTDMPKTDMFFGVQLMQSTYWRRGYYRNGYFQEVGRSLGKSKVLSFFTYSVKGGLVHRWNGRNQSDIYLWYGLRPPLLQNSFANIRQNNDLVHDLEAQRDFSGIFNHNFSVRRLKLRLGAYFLRMTQGTELGFFFTENALGLENNSAFVQEIVQDIGKRHLGLELGIKWQLLSNLSLKGVIAYGEHVYSNNPSLYLAGDDFDYTTADGYVEGDDRLTRGKRKVAMKNFHLSAGPERAFQLGLEYRDPDYWWLGITTNYFSNSFIDISFLRRSEDFALDGDGLPYTNYNLSKAKEILTQEKLPSFLLVNLVGGKSWRLKEFYLGLFASVSNLLNQSFRTGGFEDSRYASYRQQLEEQQRPGGPLFGNRYFSGLGTTYFLNFSIRF